MSFVKQSPPNTTPAAKARDDWLVPIRGCDRSCVLQRKGGGSVTAIQCPSPQGCTLILALLGIEKTPESAWRWRRWCRPGDTSWKPAAPGHSWEGAAAAASAAALAQPQDIYVPPQPGSQPVPFYFFSFKETPAERKGESNRFFQQILVQTMKKTFQERSCFYRYLLPWKVHYLPSTSILL